MKHEKDQYSSAAATPQPGWSGFDDHVMAREESNMGDETASSWNGKKPYTKPSYRYERVFETMALSCGKVGPVEFQCRFNRRNS